MVQRRMMPAQNENVPPCLKNALDKAERAKHDGNKGFGMRKPVTQLPRAKPRTQKPTLSETADEEILASTVTIADKAISDEISSSLLGKRGFASQNHEKMMGQD